MSSDCSLNEEEPSSSAPLRSVRIPTSRANPMALCVPLVPSRSLKFESEIDGGRGEEDNANTTYETNFLRVGGHTAAGEHDFRPDQGHEANYRRDRNVNVRHLHPCRISRDLVRAFEAPHSLSGPPITGEFRAREPKRGCSARVAQKKFDWRGQAVTRKVCSSPTRFQFMNPCCQVLCRGRCPSVIRRLSAGQRVSVEPKNRGRRRRVGRVVLGQLGPRSRPISLVCGGDVRPLRRFLRRGPRGLLKPVRPRLTSTRHGWRP